MSSMMISAYAGARQYNRTPLKMLKAIPAGFPLPLHDVMFGVAGHSDAIFSNIQSAGEDLRVFTSENMTPDTEIPIEVVTITPGSNLIKGFVRIPSALAINDKIYLRTTVGGGETAYGVSDLFGRDNVWQDYELVLHGNDLEIDVSGNTADGTLSGGAVKSGAALLNGWPAIGFGAREGTASTDVLTVPTPNYVEVCTESIVCYKESTQDHGAGRVFQWNGLDNECSKNGTDGLRWRRKASGGNQHINFVTSFTPDVWHYGGVIWPAIGTAPTIRWDGGSPNSPTILAGGGTITLPTGNLTIGNVLTTLILDGRIAEYRYRPDNTPTTAWLNLEWDTFNNPGSIAEAEALVSI